MVSEGEDRAAPPDVAPADEPPVTAAGRETEWVADHDSATRDTRPALGTRGEPGSWRRAADDAHVALARPAWGDARWSYLYKDDTTYGSDAEPGQVAEANRRMRGAPMPLRVHGPLMKPPVWTWEVPLYFWLGGVAAGSSFVALACDVAGDRRSARIAREVALGAVGPAPLLLIADLGRPARFLNMLRIFKPRSPMNTGAWCLVAFSAVGSAAVGADVARRPAAARGLGAANALLGGYLGSYTGVLLAATAVPLWARSRLLLAPIFVATATATGAAATRLTLVARGLPAEHPTRHALGRLEAAAMLVELVLSTLNERRLGQAGQPLREGRSGRIFAGAKRSVQTGLALQAVTPLVGPRAQDAASLCYLVGGLAFRYAWVEAGKASARDHEAVARMARRRVTVEDDVLPPSHRRRALRSHRRAPVASTGRLGGGWTEAVRRTSLLVERLLPGHRGQ
jgi:Polysulphide reductase, NrfD